jgi:hypothetical protein
MLTGIVGSHPVGFLSVGISPVILCICHGSALIHHPMLDVYGTKGGRSKVGRRVVLHLPVISTNWVLVFVSTMCVARAGCAQSVGWFEKRRRSLLVMGCCSHVSFEWWYNVFCSASKYHSDCWWCCSNQSPSCRITQLSGVKWSSANYQAFHMMGRCWTGHAHDEFLPTSHPTFLAQSAIPCPSWEAMSDR